MDEIIRKRLFKPYSKLNKQSYGNLVSVDVNYSELLILHEGESPTLAYFEASIRDRFVGIQTRFINTSISNELNVGKGSALVIIRFINPAWQRRVADQIENLSRVIYFMDDDLFDPSALNALPKDYRLKIIRRSAAQHRWVTEFCDDIWVSTDYLARKYAHLNPDILCVSPSSFLLEKSNLVKIAYHGSSSHRDEKIWLRSVIERVLERCPQSCFEIFGEHEIYKLYRDLPRVSVLHPMSWDNYLAYTKSHHVDIGLAPLLDSGFNAARGPVKFYDFVRMGAVGVYSNCQPYSGLIEQNVNGILLQNSVERWVNAIHMLCDDKTKRNALVVNAKNTAQSKVKK